MEIGVVVADKEDKKEERSGGGKWWEFYLVRYALGTVFGVLIVNVLIKGGLATPFPENSISEISKPEGYPLLIAYGLAYCYLASAPILVFHASRFAIKTKGLHWSTILCLLISTVCACTWVSAANVNGFTAALLVSSTMAIWAVMFVLSTQIRALWRGMASADNMWAFYLKLDKNRRNPQNRELVDSYRHLREHGNAFFVVLLELLLGLCLYVAGKVSIFPPMVISKCNANSVACDAVLTTSLVQTIAVVFIWIAPAAVVWTIGCLLEAKFAEDTTIGPVISTAPPVATGASNVPSPIRVSTPPAP